MADKVDTITATAFQRSIGEHVDNVRTNKRVLLVQSHGRDQVVLMPVERYRELQRTEQYVRAAGSENTE